MKIKFVIHKIVTGETLYPGTIAAANADGTFAIAYDDGDIGWDIVWFRGLAYLSLLSRKCGSYLDLSPARVVDPVTLHPFLTLRK